MSNNDHASENMQKQIRDLKRIMKEKVEEFWRNPSDQTIEDVLNVIFLAYIYNITCFVPATIDTEKKGAILKKTYVPERAGFANILFTDLVVAENKKDIYIQISYRTALQTAMSTEGIKGFVVNPGSNHPTLFMSRINMGSIIKSGEETIHRFGPEFEADLKKIKEDSPAYGPGGSELH